VTTERVPDLACDNRKCAQYGMKGAGNVTLRRRYGAEGIRFVRCLTCKQEFSERRNTPLFGLKLPREKVIDVVRHLAEGVPGRRTHRLTGVGRETVNRIVKAVGKHAKEIHDQLVQGLDVAEAQMDEMWSFVGKKRQASDRRGEAIRRAWEHVGSHRRGR
jgi:transposase-like protein